MNKVSFKIITIKEEKKRKKYGAHSHVRATARLEEHIIHSRGQRYVVPLSKNKKLEQKQVGSLKTLLSSAVLVWLNDLLISLLNKLSKINIYTSLMKLLKAQKRRITVASSNKIHSNLWQKKDKNDLYWESSLANIENEVNRCQKVG